MINKLTLSLSLFIALLMLPLSLGAQGKKPENRDAWMKEMQQYKVEYISKALNLSEEQKTKFASLYNAMDDEIRKTQKMAENIAKQTSKNEAKATDAEFERAAMTLYELKGKENAIEMRYFREFKKILSPKQLFRLKDVERDFTMQLMKHQRSAGKNKGKK